MHAYFSMKMFGYFNRLLNCKLGKAYSIDQGDFGV